MIHNWKSLRTTLQLIITQVFRLTAYFWITRGHLIPCRMCCCRKKLCCLGISNVLLMWIKAYLSERQQCVILNSLCSSSFRVLSGVPQGPVLGPLLFLVFINDVSDNSSSRGRLYADDCCIYGNITCEADTVQL